MAEAKEEVAGGSRRLGKTGTPGAGGAIARDQPLLRHQMNPASDYSAAALSIPSACM